MSSAAAREARRKAILSRGSDRLSKLTSSARGEDHPAYVNTDPPTRKAPTTETFIGEESVMPTPPARASPAPASVPPSNSAAAAGPSAWSAEQQQEFMRALMAAPELTGPHRESQSTSTRREAPQVGLEDFGADAGDDPMAAMLSALTQITGQTPPGLGTMPMGQTARGIPLVSPPTFFTRLRPLLHLLASWVLLAFFAMVKEPKLYVELPGAHAIGGWERWSELSWRSAKEPFGVQPVPFFWAFTTLQLVLHSVEIFTKSNPIQPPALLALALPHLPPMVRSVITNALAYVRMGGMLLDDVAGLVVGVGVLIWVAGWVVGQ
ncbi:hypothetical protein M0805_007686 [Coniferiporia weirii]|nr:hypothetical protein M0805_007686 [Coniferiporia weirii]